MRELQNILVTGGAGFIGSAFVRWLLRRDDFEGRIVNLDALTYAGNLGNLQPVRDDTRHHFVHGDIRDAELVTRLCDEHGIDAVVNFAAESHVDRSIKDPRAFIETNVMGVFVLLEAARARNLHFHQVSTDEVFGSLGAAGRFVEDSPYDPRSPYSASKAAADHMVRAYGNTYGLSFTVSNCSNNYGPFQFPEKLLPLMILNCLDGRPLPIYGDGGQVRDWLYVDDHAEALWAVLSRGESGESYNVGGDCELRNVDLVHRLLAVVAELSGRRLADLEALLTYVTDRPGHDRRYAIDATKIQQRLGWRPHHDIDAGLRRTVAWYLENRDWIDGVRSGAYRTWIEQNYAGR